MEQTQYWEEQHAAAGYIEVWEVGLQRPVLQWTLADANKGLCASSVIGKDYLPPINLPISTTWTTHDEAVGRCLPADVGRRNPNVPSPAPIMFDIAEVPARRLKKDVLAAYHEVGGKDYLVRMANADPAQFNKLLAKILPQAIEADIKLEAKAVDLDSVTTSQLKQMYLKMMAENGQIIDVDTTDK